MPTLGAWQEIAAVLDFAFQPIVNIHTGACFGFEGLLRNVKKAGFDSIQAVFDTAFVDRSLPQVEMWLREKAIRRFADSGFARQAHLFLNLDNRVLEFENDTTTPATNKLLDEYDVPRGSVCFEISERHPFLQKSGKNNASLLAKKQEGFKIAIDDFGTGFSGLQMLYYAEPDFIKIDRFFISDISTDSKKKLFVSNIVNIAHMLGISVIAEGIETEREFYICKEIGCDLAQGYLIQHPQMEISALKPKYELVETLSRNDKRRHARDQDFICQQVESIPAISVDSTMVEVFEKFRANKENTFFPVVNSLNQPLGVVRECQMKRYVYSQYGKELLRNKSMRQILPLLISKCPIADINTETEKILEMFSQSLDADGILIVENMSYLGFLSAKSLLKVIHEKNLRIARDQNPLSKLPGNYMIYEYLSRSLNDLGSAYTLVYLDFDNFKPFNDRYGFRKGDRAIVLFAEILKRELLREKIFIGHIGGDDFFAGFENCDFKSAYEQISRMMQTFRNDMEAFYDTPDRERNSILARDREGHLRNYPLLTISAAIVELPAQAPRPSLEEVSSMIARIKKNAKASDSRICAASVFMSAPSTTPATEAEVVIAPTQLQAHREVRISIAI